jgi:hypothetical protein
MMKCAKCGGAEFYARQPVRGTIPVIVDGNGSFLENHTEDGAIDPEGLDFGDPAGPFTCTQCGTEYQGGS